MFALVPADAQSLKKESATRGAWRFRAYQKQQGLGEPHSAGAETALLALRTPAQKFNPGVKGRLPDPRGKPGSQGSNAYAGERLTLCWREMDSNFQYRGTKARDFRRIPARLRRRQSEPQPPLGSAQAGRERPVRRRKWPG